MSPYRVCGALGALLAWVVMGAAPARAQAITEAWVAEQLGGQRRAARLQPGQDAASRLPTLSLVIRYRPETGALTPASARALGPLFGAVSAFAPTSFRMVCCAGLPAAEGPRLSRQLVAELSRLFADRGRGRHVQFQLQPSPVAGLPYVGQANAARLDVYKLP